VLERARTSPSACTDWAEKLSSAAADHTASDPTSSCRPRDHMAMLEASLLAKREMFVGYVGNRGKAWLGWLWRWQRLEMGPKERQSWVVRAECAFAEEKERWQARGWRCAPPPARRPFTWVLMFQSQLSIGHGSSHDASMHRQSGPWGPASNFTPLRPELPASWPPIG
jgi:hypothetical protein